MNLFQDSPLINPSRNAKLDYLNMKTEYAHSRAIAAAAAEECLTFRVLAIQNSVPDTLTRFQIRSDGNIDFNKCLRQLAEALGNAAKPERYHEEFLAENDRTPYFRLREIPAISEDFPQYSSRFRQLLCAPPSHRVEREHPLPGLTMAKVALELAECGLLFLGTNWLADICSCGLHCRLLRDVEEYHCTISTSNTEHFTPSWGTFVPQRCWCDANELEVHTNPPGALTNKPLLRIGLLLAEIGFGYPMLEEQVVDTSLPGKKRLLFACEQPPRTSDKSLEQIVKDLKDTSSYQYWKAVEHCLKSKLSIKDVMIDGGGSDQRLRRALSDYYENVLVP